MRAIAEELYMKLPGYLIDRLVVMTPEEFVEMQKVLTLRIHESLDLIP